MNGPTYTKILADTCFLISLVNTQDVHHNNAEEYFRHFISSKADLYLPTICLSEFLQKQEPEILENFRLISFGVNEVAAQRKHFSKETLSNLPGDIKSQVKDDVKILSSGLAHGVEAVLSTNDDFIRRAQDVGLGIIDYRIPLQQFIGQLPFNATSKNDNNT